MTHTPGPWEVTEHEGCTIIVDSDRNVVARPPWPVSKDDASLIAAAPALLEACREATDWLEKMMEDADPGEWQKVIKRARAAIAQAKGE